MAQPKRQEETKGTIEHIRYFDSNFLIAQLDTGLVIKGSMLEPLKGVEYTFQGKLTEDKKWGRQFAFTGYQTNKPTSREAILYYISHNAKWIGPVIAERLYEAYGADTLKILKESPERTSNGVKGLSKAHAIEASEMLKANEANEKAMLDLKEVLGAASIGQNQINQMLDLWRHEAAAYVRKYPYGLPEWIRGIGFHTADEIAYRLGYSRDGEPRIQAGVLHVLKQGQSDGHVCLPRGILLTKAYELLNIQRGDVGHIVEGMTKGKEPKLVIDADYVYSVSSFEDEIYIADKIQVLMSCMPSVYPNANVNSKGLFGDQEKALGKVQTDNVFILSGSPGVGKSHLIKKILELFEGYQVELCCPTGKGAKRMYELTGKPARTIHSLLVPFPIKGKMEFQRNEASPLDAQVVIVDEVSMVDNWLMASLLRAIKPGSRLILVGDFNQLPSVGAGNVLKEMIESEKIPHEELTEIKRQQPGLIIKNCHAIKNRGSVEYEDADGSLDFLFVDRQEVSGAIDIIKSILLEAGRPQARLLHVNVFGKYLAAVPDSGYGALDVLRDIQVLSPLREKTDLSVKALNKELQMMLNPKAKFTNRVKAFFEGDKVIQRKNEYDLGIINGDMGFVHRVDYHEKELEVKFENPERMVPLSLKENNLELAYAITCHSAQGSEWPIVIIPIHAAFGSLIMQRNWLYTAISRAQRLCILVGQRAEIPKIIGRNQQQYRYTQLAYKINSELEVW